MYRLNNTRGAISCDTFYRTVGKELGTGTGTLPTRQLHKQRRAATASGIHQEIGTVTQRTLPNEKDGRDSRRVCAEKQTKDDDYSNKTVQITVNSDNDKRTLTRAENDRRGEQTKRDRDRERERDDEGEE